MRSCSPGNSPLLTSGSQSQLSTVASILLLMAKWSMPRTNIGDGRIFIGSTSYKVPQIHNCFGIPHRFPGWVLFGRKSKKSLRDHGLTGLITSPTTSASIRESHLFANSAYLSTLQLNNLELTNTTTSKYVTEAADLVVMDIPHLTSISIHILEVVSLTSQAHKSRLLLISSMTIREVSKKVI